MAVAACVALVGATLFAVFERTAESQNFACAHGTVGLLRRQSKGNHRWHQDSTTPRGSLAGKGTFKASGAITDTGTALAYRTVGSQGTLITLRYVTKGNKGTITYVVKIDTNAGTSRWTIASSSGVYKGLHGKGRETENATYTVSVLRGTVSR